ncbi:hypothetical protein R1sor_007860 [Riccia sorocarpa]|uniref:Uncharacterized protein n=1 Tax=Riccia sorocarpa TaxID=122646 RepID=A0ABD3HU22_9MARC
MAPTINASRFVTLNVNDTLLLLWKHTKDEPASLGILRSSTKLKVLAMKEKDDFIFVLIDKVTKSQPIYKLLKFFIKGALSAGVSGVLPEDTLHYLSYPELATTTPSRPAVDYLDESDEEERVMAEDIHQSKHMKLWAAAKKHSKDKSKVVLISEPKKKLITLFQEGCRAHRHNILKSK